MGFRSSRNPKGDRYRKGYSEDEHIPNLLLFNPRARFHEEEAYHSGKVILQDKASCFSATVLAQDIHEHHGDFIDATAAPGNKTTHLSALLGNQGKVSTFANYNSPVFRPQTNSIDRRGLAVRVRAGRKAVHDIEVYGQQGRLSKRGTDEC